MKWTKRILSVLLTFSLLAVTLLSGTPSVVKGAEEQMGTQTPTNLNCANYTNVAPLDINRTSKVQPFKAAQDNDGIVTSKTVTSNEDGTYTLRLESYVTGETSITQKNKATDTVLVLDVSGSMEDYMDFVIEITDDNLKVLDPKLQNNYQFHKNKYEILISHDMRYNDGQWEFKDGFEWKKCTDYPNGIVFSRKIGALKTVVNMFIDLAAEKEGSNRISIVTFSDSAVKRTPLLEASTEKDRLKKVIYGLHADGATGSNEGMAKAEEIISKIESDRESKKVAIMFTDGVPTLHSDFSDIVANGAIRHSNALKNKYGATVYSIGVFEDADPTANINNKPKGLFNKYMHGVSSNYPNATGYRELGELNDKANPFNGGKSYYLAADNAESLSEIFQSISDEIGGASVELNEKTVIKDVVSDYFKLPEGASEQDIVIKTADCNEFDNNDVPKFEEDKPYKQGKVKINGQDISVTGFNFSENYVGKNKNTGEVHPGKKLIIEIPIVRSEDFIGGNNVPTNTDKSGVYDENGKLMETFEVPTANVEIKYNYETSNQEIFLGDRADLENRIVIGTVNGRNNKYVDIVYTVTDENGTKVGTYEIKNGEPKGIWEWIPEKNPELKKDTEYSVVCTVKPVTEGEVKQKEIEKDFTVFVKTGTLIISKSGGNPDEKYIFNIKKDGKHYMSVTVNGENSVTVTNLPKGSYTVTEDVDWSWRWKCTFEKNTADIDLENQKDELSFNNNLNNNKWLNDYDYKVNKMGGAQ